MELRLKFIHFPKKISPLPWKWPKFTKMYKMATEKNWNCCILLYFPKSYQISQAIGNQESLALGWNLVHCMLFGSYWIQIAHRNKVPGNIEVKKKALMKRAVAETGRFDELKITCLSSWLYTPHHRVARTDHCQGENWGSQPAGLGSWRGGYTQNWAVLPNQRTRPVK